MEKNNNVNKPKVKNTNNSNRKKSNNKKYNPNKKRTNKVNNTFKEKAIKNNNNHETKLDVVKKEQKIEPKKEIIKEEQSFEIKKETIKEEQKFQIQNNIKEKEISKKVQEEKIEKNVEENFEYDKNSIKFILILFVILFVLILCIPKIYKFVENAKLPKIEVKEKIDEVEERILDSETLSGIHYPIMRNSIYDANTYYSLDKFSISDMSNNDILYNAFLDIYEGNIISLNKKGNCTTQSKSVNSIYMKFRIENILGKNVSYSFDSFYVPEDSNSNYKGNWIFDSSSNKFIYQGLCKSKAASTTYYDLEEFISADYDGDSDDIIVYYYVGFAKVVNNNYTIYSDPSMTKKIEEGVFTSIEDLNTKYKNINKKHKKKYKYIFKNTLCTYSEYCLYEGKWLDEI